MRRILPRSLKGLLLLNESALLALVLVTATLTGLWTWFWTQSSQEAARIETLARLAERVRGDMYRQLQEVVHARLTENPAALRVYPGYRRQIAERFVELHGLVRDDSERAAVEYLQDAYAVVLDDMEKVFVDPNVVAESARMKLLDPAYEEWMLSELESALRSSTRSSSVAGRDSTPRVRAGLGGRRSWCPFRSCSRWRSCCSRGAACRVASSTRCGTWSTEPSR